MMLAPQLSPERWGGYYLRKATVERTQGRKRSVFTGIIRCTDGACDVSHQVQRAPYAPVWSASRRRASSEVPTASFQTVAGCCCTRPSRLLQSVLELLLRPPSFSQSFSSHEAQTIPAEILPSRFWIATVFSTVLLEPLQSMRASLIVNALTDIILDMAALGS
jgi:hypothetical protein